MTVKYDYLKKYIPGGPNVNKTRFWPLLPDEIEQGEEKMQRKFPPQLKEFYQEIGSGYLKSPYNAPEDYETYDRNEILSPVVAAHFYNLVIEHHKKPEDERTSLEVLLDLDRFYITYEDSSITVEVLDVMEPGDLPFFEIGESCLFMVMKLNSDNPNAVWSDTGNKIEDSLERFIWRLYYEDPSYHYIK
ncbi:MAG: SMI1/KNR4 family protein [Caedimonas sp.]|nr:SMI1/KNR4 family protein [Caedimonas sp.]